MRCRLVGFCFGLVAVLPLGAAFGSATLRPGPRTTYVLAAIIDVCIKTHPDLADQGLRAFANSVGPYVKEARDYVRQHPDAAYDAQFKVPNLGITPAQLDNICPKIASSGWPMRRQGIVNWQFRQGYVENIW
ncbi:hypothetical protein [Dyella sp.]|jgi:hypothetical protein|uniref:hypothetical protein n=1 Tax=Dyella sp. TaxID=1869338 RepID=UPI002C85C0AB|nr:hypothetical protein [Dyella sp.]HTC27097.1 hypothetical protein [Dyella sp.]